MNSFAQQPKLILPIGHTDTVLSAHFSPDGKKVITASSDKTAKVWDVQTGKLIADLKGHISKINVAAFSPDGKKIITASGNIVRIWNTETWKYDSILPGHTDEILAACFSLDGKKIITASADNRIRIWNIKPGKTDTILEHNASVTSIEFSPDGKKFISASLDHTAKLWDAKTDSLIATLQGHTSGLQFAHFSRNGEKIITVSISKKDSVKVKIWNAVTGKFIADLRGDTAFVWSAYFSPDGKKIITASQDQTAKIWDAVTGKLDTVNEHEDAVISANYSPDGKKIVTVSNNVAKILDVKTDSLIFDLTGHTAPVRSAEFSPDGKKIITSSSDNTSRIWNVETGMLIADLKGHTSAVKTVHYSPDGKKIVTASADSTAKIWDAETGKLIAHLNGVYFKSVRFSSDSKKIITSSYGNNVKIWDAETGAPAGILAGHGSSVNDAEFSPDGKKIVTASNDKFVKIWDTETDSLIADLRKHKGSVNSAKFSFDGKNIVTASDDNTVKIWNAETPQQFQNLEGHHLKVTSAEFSPDGKKIVSASLDNSVRVWDVASGKIDTVLFINAKAPNGVISASYSSDGEKIVSLNVIFVTVWDAGTGKIISELKEDNAWFTSAVFSPNGKKIVTASDDDTVKIWDAETGHLDNVLAGHDAAVNAAEFSPDGKNIITASDDNTVKIWNAETGKNLYTFFAVDSLDYLLFDDNYRYDGSESVRKFLYFICGDEVIDLGQVKDSLWIPGLAEMILKNEIIVAPKLSELKMCGLAPKVEYTGANSGTYYFNILPRRGGLGEVSLTLNGALTLSYDPSTLTKKGDTLKLKIVEKTDLKGLLSPGIINKLFLKAYSEDNSISSTEAVVNIDKRDQATAPANLYAVMVGVSDYKDSALDLQYAAIDATDISNTIADAARKLLNKDGKEHVFMYNLTTAKGSYSWPEKKNIKAVLDSIGKKANANDILLIFLSGHGVMEGKDKEFYFLTANASEKLGQKAFDTVGISTTDIAKWIRPKSMLAQQRILILDACNSGQAISDITNLGLGSQRVKVIDKLNERSGLFILSASSSNQSAYESDKYSHGYLTYSLLKAIKQQPDILEDGHLNVSRWFNAAKKTVSELAIENGNNQEPQIVTNTNINIGEVDAEVMANIKLAGEKPLFSASSFQNDDTAANGDNLKLSKSINQELREISFNESASKIVYTPATESSEAFSLLGRYYITGNAITIHFSIIKNDEPVVKFSEKGTTNNLKELVKKVVGNAIEWTTTNK